MAAALVVSRLSDQQLAVLAGAVCGAGLALPLGAALGAYAWSRRGSASPDRPAAPPVIYVSTAPAPEPAGLPKPNRFTDDLPVARRAFSVIGGEELDET
jgi:hypothetical protein